MAQTQVQPRSKIIKSGEVWNNGDDEKPKKYVTLQDIQAGYDDYVGLSRVTQFMVFAMVLFARCSQQAHALHLLLTNLVLLRMILLQS